MWMVEYHAAVLDADHDKFLDELVNDRTMYQHGVDVGRNEETIEVEVESDGDRSSYDKTVEVEAGSQQLCNDVGLGSFAQSDSIAVVVVDGDADAGYVIDAVLDDGRGIADRNAAVAADVVGVAVVAVLNTAVEPVEETKN